VKNVTIFGATGFLGRHAVKHLAEAGFAVRVASRWPERASYLKPLGDVGQIIPVQANVRDDETVKRAVEGADGVVNLVGLLYERGAQNFSSVHVDGARRVAAAAANAGAKRFVHVSAIGADEASPSAYARSKATAETAVRGEFANATILRPSLVFGPEDDFFNRFGALARLSPVLPLFFDKMPTMRWEGIFATPEFEAGTTNFQPVYAGDVARAIGAGLSQEQTAGKTYELGGPAVYSFRDLMELVLETTQRKRWFVPVPFFAVAVMARFAQFMPDPPITPDQVRLLKLDNVIAAGALTLHDLGIGPTALELILPTYMHRYRKGRDEASPVAEA